MKRNFTRGTAAFIKLLLITTSLWVPSCMAIASPHSHSHDSIIEAATQFALQNHASASKVEVSISPLDTRLKLPECSAELSLFWPPGATHTGQTTVGVQCRGTQPWKIFVRALVSVYDDIAVLSTAVIAGDVVSKDNVTIELMDLSTLRGDVVKEIDPLLGYRYKRRYQAGRPLTKSMVSLPRLVHKGDDVLIVSSASLLKVRMKGTALANGEQGSVIHVRNSSSHRVIQGQVVSRGIVQVVP